MLLGPVFTDWLFYTKCLVCSPELPEVSDDPAPGLYWPGQDQTALVGILCICLYLPSVGLL